MTFPWKKAKSTLFSRLVADLHRPHKRGGTLVVETGFPTSLVDLIVKNRDRLRKSPKRKSTSQIQTPSTAHLSSSPPRSFAVPPCDEMVQCPRVDVGKLTLVQSGCAGRGRIAFRAAFKVIIVAALAVSTRQLTLWIMMAAFLLLLLEFVGASVFGFLLPEPCTILLDWEEAPSVPDTIELTDFEDDCVPEIQIVESEFDCAGETQIQVEEKETEGKTELSRSGRIRRRLIKKLVPKKLRHGKKKSEDQWGAADMHKMEEVEQETQEEKIPRADQDSWEESETAERRSSGHRLSASLIVIVLAGLLVGGRGAALLITLVWCLMQTYVRRFR
ncbi:hypothetical protein like AT5G44350 [Hibiscus trionum]|uniref:Uncharacterized protein n=1 Tax=Hibiscus trionum TaxID=183268 RepID=A0A9W7HJL2_HIBTR|nr:hypothetical protein like AT5G44350 [Hibiscus trionum]